MKKFNLSEKIIPYCWVEDIEELKKTNKADILYQDETILIEDVKQFIRLTTQPITERDFIEFTIEMKKIPTTEEVLKWRINKLAGEKLTK